MDEIELTTEERKKMNYKFGERKKCAECNQEFYVAKRKEKRNEQQKSSD